MRAILFSLRLSSLLLASLLVPVTMHGQSDVTQRVVQTAIRSRLARTTLLRRRDPPEVWLRWRADQVKPAADVHLGVGFAAVVPSPGRVGGLGIPSVHGKLGISALNHKPVGGMTGHDSTDFASELL